MNIPHIKEQKLRIYYDNIEMNKYFKVDFVCYDEIILELKAISFMNDTDYKQVINYLKATKFKLALLVNFGTPSLTYKRIVN